MGLFGKKKKVNCISCKTELDLNEARVVNGQYFCPACDIRRKAAAAKAAQEKAASPANTGSDKVHPAIAAIKKAFDEADIHSAVSQWNERWELVAGISGKHSSYQIKYICHGNGNAVAIRVFGLAHFPKGREQAAYRLLNGLQSEYRYLKFTLDEDNDVRLEYDLPQDTDLESVGAIGREMLLRIMRMIDEFYPEIMKAIWA